MTLDLVPVWTLIIGFSVFMYVLLDGFDLGIGMLFPFAPDDAARDTMMATVAPIWDGNETWLVMGGIGLFAAFPLAFAIILPALYFPLLAMLLGLVFRGVAFEFRAHARGGAPGSVRFWDVAFSAGSTVATFAQGCVLGRFVLGFDVRDGAYAGGTFDWVHPFVLATGGGLVAGYALLGAAWLVLKTTGPLADWARRMARFALAGTLAFIAMVSVVTPLFSADIAARWFDWPNMLLLAPIPLATLAAALAVRRGLARGPDLLPFIGALALFALGYLGLAVSLLPYIVPRALTLWDAASDPSTQAFLLLGTLPLLPIVLGYTGWSYWVFRGKVRPETGYHAP